MRKPCSFATLTPARGCLVAVAVWISVSSGGPVPRVEGAEQTTSYEVVQRAFLREDFERAASLAQAFILENPTSAAVPRVWLWLALSLDRLQHANEALAEVDRLKTRLRSNDPLWAETLFWEGEISRRALQMVRAKLAYQRLLDRYPSSPWESQAQLGMGLFYLHQQAFEPALGYFHHVALRQPVSPMVLDAMLYEGLCSLQLKRLGWARKTTTRVIERCLPAALPSSTRIGCNTGVLHYPAMQVMASIRLDSKTESLLAEIGARKGLTKSGCIRLALERFIEAEQVADPIVPNGTAHRSRRSFVCSIVVDPGPLLAWSIRPTSIIRGPSAGSNACW